MPFLRSGRTNAADRFGNKGEDQEVVIPLVLTMQTTYGPSYDNQAVILNACKVSAGLSAGTQGRAYRQCHQATWPDSPDRYSTYQRRPRWLASFCWFRVSWITLLSFSWSEFAARRDFLSRCCCKTSAACLVHIPWLPSWLLG